MSKAGVFLVAWVGVGGWCFGQSPTPVSLQTPDPYALTTEEPAQREFVSPSRKRKLSLGINYTGAQVRWDFSRRWAGELRYQQGTAESDFGTVTAQVYGIRAYRFFNTQGRWPLYWGGELARTEAKPKTSAYRTSGFAAGGFGGFEYRMGSRVALDIDIGPYVISLEETQSKQTSTTLDFVLNTALVVKVF